VNKKLPKMLQIPFASSACRKSNPSRGVRSAAADFGDQVDLSLSGLSGAR
jgi:hypothetical protein